MPPIATGSQDEPSSRQEEPDPAAERRLLNNFVILAAYQIVMRTGWIFKTESIIMPAVLDTVAGAGWVRGWLPLLNRFGHSIPPLLMARQLNVAPFKKRLLFLATAPMAGLFLLLSFMFTGIAQQGYVWMPALFLAIYTAFFAFIGVSQLAFNTLQGKLVGTTSRGRLLLVSNTIGAVTAVVCAFLLLPIWLNDERPRFDLIFGFSGLLFTVSALLVLRLVEQPDDFQQPRMRILAVFVDSWTVWRSDPRFRRLTVVGSLFGVSIMLFPHYQNLGLQQMDMQLSSLMWWVIVQNVGTGLFSIPVGRIADRHGNRLVLLITLLGVAAAPLLAVVIRAVPAWGGRWFFVVFVFVGLTPVVLRTLQNFALELAPPDQHPRYLSSQGLWMSAPMFLSPLVGLLIDAVGFSPVFLAVAATVLLGWLLTFRLDEPRRHISVDYLQGVD